MTSSWAMALLTRSSMISSRPYTLAYSTRVKLVLGLTGKMPTPRMLTLALRSFSDLTIFYHLGMSSRELTLRTMRVTCRV